jgi:hypothetical protein
MTYGTKVFYCSNYGISEYDTLELNNWFNENKNIKIIKTKYIKNHDGDIMKIFIMYQKIGRKEKLEELNNKSS